MINTIEKWNTALVALGVAPRTALRWGTDFCNVLGAANLSGCSMSAFLAQILHESRMLECTEENLMYSAARLMQVWPKRFPTMASAQPYAYNPRALANKVYGGRLGNIGPDDGWRYRGRGLIQITGRANYALSEELTRLPLVEQPGLLGEPKPALAASLAWWAETIPDEAMTDVALVTRYVNGGTTGLAERQRLTDKASSYLKKVTT